MPINSDISLQFSNYRLFPYERDLAVREVRKNFNTENLSIDQQEIIIREASGKYEDLLSVADRLTYFQSIKIEDKTIELLQSKREKDFQIKNTSKRQSTRFSSHGIHDYKGKFNPQTASAIINYFCLKNGDSLLDPFCGSGTTLLEAQNKKIDSLGIDINPLATFVANSKLSFERFDKHEFIECFENLRTSICNNNLHAEDAFQHPNIEYLSKWFEYEILIKISYLFDVISKISSPQIANFFKCCASDLLRDYSLQEPQDLRIRRRKSPMPEVDIFEKFTKKIEHFARIVNDLPDASGQSSSTAICADIRDYRIESELLFDAAITSPPYATALPYIDTQRLSLIWLNILSPEKVRALEQDLIGSRELKKSAQNLLTNSILDSQSDLPKNLSDLCKTMQSSLNDSDGFRRQATPSLIYRYFIDMQKMFANTKRYMKQGALFGLIVGHNRTTLGGVEFNLDTPSYLVELAENVGWKLEEKLSFETYRRYGLHQNNSGHQENLIVLSRT